jgi:signal transduction histidine kinase
MALLVPTLVLIVANDTLAEDPYFSVAALMMIVGYTTVGALIASRAPRNAIGWLLVAVGVTFALAGFSTEYLEYAYVTQPGSLPVAPALGIVSNAFWLPTFVAVILLALLFPTGCVPSPRWRHVPRAILVLAALGLVIGLIYPGPVDLDIEGVRIVNPLGVEALRPIVDPVASVVWIGILLVGGPASVVAVFLRYRRSRGEERQQLRWLATIAGATAVIVGVGFALTAVLGDDYGDSFVAGVLFIAGFACVGVGVPVAIGVALLRYRLYDLDLVIKKTVLYAILVGVFTLIAYLIVLAVPTLVVGLNSVPVLVLAPILALGFFWIHRPARRLADRIVYGGRATPYEVLSEFSERMGGTYSTDDVLPRMAQLVGDATGARTASVWLRVGERFRALATWPGDADPPQSLEAKPDHLPDFGSDVAFEIRHQGELLGALTLSTPANDPMNATKERLVQDLAVQTGLVLRNVGLIEDLRASRQRLVAAQDAERRRIERNIHDGAQQQLVALAVKQRLAASFIGKDDDRLRSMLDDLQRETNETLQNLRDLARGIYPPLLSDKGLAAAIEAQARKVPVPTTVRANGVGRYRQDTEAAVYFCVLEALQNVSKYAEASEVLVTLGETNGDLTFTVRDNGVGFDPKGAHGLGLTNMRDRLQALGGALEVQAVLGSGTTVQGKVPVGDSGSSYEGFAAAQADSSRSGPKTALGM